jgi:hypothetical protein
MTVSRRCRFPTVMAPAYRKEPDRNAAISAIPDRFVAARIRTFGQMWRRHTYGAGWKTDLLNRSKGPRSGAKVGTASFEVTRRRLSHIVPTAATGDRQPEDDNG